MLHWPGQLRPGGDGSALRARGPTVPDARRVSAVHAAAFHMSTVSARVALTFVDRPPGRTSRRDKAGARCASGDLAIRSRSPSRRHTSQALSYPPWKGSQPSGSVGRDSAGARVFEAQRSRSGAITWGVPPEEQGKNPADGTPHEPMERCPAIVVEHADSRGRPRSTRHRSVDVGSTFEGRCPEGEVTRRDPCGYWLLESALGLGAVN